jgi:hypothetical protein
MKIITPTAIAFAFALTIIVLCCQASLAQGEVVVREYTSENGRKIRITANGNVIGLETPAGYENIAGQRSREGYVVSYIDQTGTTRIIHDVFDSYSSTIKSGYRDFVPVSFTAPPSASDLAVNTLIAARTVLDTRDGLLRLENVITWIAGTGTVSVKMTITNRSATSVRLLNLKRAVDINAGGDTLNTSFVLPNEVYYFNPVCTCRPPIPPGPWVPLVVFSGGPNAVALNLHASDDSELFNVGPGPSLIGRQTDIDTQGVLIFKADAPLPPGGSMTGNVTHDIR